MPPLVPAKAVGVTQLYCSCSALRLNPSTRFQRRLYMQETPDHEPAPAQAAQEESEPQDAPQDPVAAMVKLAFSNAVEQAEKSETNGATSGANGSDGDSQGPQQHTIRVTGEMHQALFLLNQILFRRLDDNPAFLLKMDPENFEEDLYSAIESQNPEQVARVPVAQFARVLQPLCQQLHDAAGKQGASSSKASADTSAQSSAETEAKNAPASSSGGGRPRLPARAPRSVPANSTSTTNRNLSARSTNSDANGNQSNSATVAPDVQEYRDNLQQLRVDICRMFLKNGLLLSNLHLRQTLHRLKVSEMQAAPFSATRASLEESAKTVAQDLETQGAPLDRRIVIAVIGLSGAGKTSLIHRMLGKPPVDPFEGGTKKCSVIDGDLHGIPMRFIDSPGLELGFEAQQRNRFKMIGLKRMLQKKGNQPHCYFFVDRMDVERRQETDVGLLSSVYSVLGRAELYTTIGILTYASTKPPDSKAGPLEYEAWSAPRIRAMQLAMMTTASDRTAQYFIAPAENHPRCRIADGEPVLPNGHRWMSHLVGLVIMFMGLSSATVLPKPKSLKSRDTSTSHAMDIRKLFGGGEKQVPVTYILQQYNQPKSVHKLPDEERSILSPGEITRMKEVQHERAREEQRRRREYMKLREEEARTPEPVVPTLAPDPPLPPVFDALQDTYRYRYNENQAGWIVRPFVDSNGPDRSDGINGGQAERSGTMRLPNQFIGGAPSRVLFQSVKDKESMVLVCNAETSASMGRDNVITASLESQTLSGDAIYTVRVEPRLKYGEFGGRKRFKTALGLINTRIGEEFDPRRGPVAKGVRLEQRVRLTDGLKLIGTHVGMMGGTSSMRERGRAYGLEASFKPKSSIEGRELMVGWNTMRTRRFTMSGRDIGGQQVQGGTLAMVQHLSPETVLNSRVQMNGNGQSTLSVRVTSHDKMAMRWAYVMPVLGWLYDKVSKRSNGPVDF